MQHCGKTLSLSAFCLCSHLGDVCLFSFLTTRQADRTGVVTTAQTEKIITKTRYVAMLDDSGSVEVGN